MAGSPSRIAAVPESGQPTFIIERRKQSFFSPTIYSIRSAESEGSDLIQLFAQANFGPQSHYVISGDIDDLSKARKHRSQKFVGKLQIEYERRVYIGYAQNTRDREKQHLVSVIYDHERMASVDLKVEIGLPLVPSAYFHDEFMRIFREGLQNLEKKNEILILKQHDDTSYMAKSDSLKELGGTAAVVSTKNFALVKATPLRKSQYVSKDPEASVSAPEDAHADQLVMENDIFMQFGRLDEDRFSCHFSNPVSLHVAFMIILSRFDTTQKYA
jgi:hypothetical protein